MQGVGKRSRFNPTATSASGRRVTQSLLHTQLNNTPGIKSVGLFQANGTTAGTTFGSMIEIEGRIGDGATNKIWQLQNSPGGNPYFGIAYTTTQGTVATPSVVIDTAGNVGIGTTAPTAKLHINTTDNSTTPLQIQGLNATGQQVTLLSTQNVTGNTTSLTDFCISGGKCLSGVISSGAETDPKWTANITNYFTKAQWNATNVSYALNQTLTDMWTPFLSTTNASYLMIDKFNVTNTTYREKYNYTWVGNLNSTGTVYSEGINNLTIPFLFNSTGLIRNWNVSGDIQNWNASTYIRNWGLDTSLLNTTNLSYYPIWNPYGYYNSTNPSPVTNESYLKDYGDTATGNYTFDTNTLFIDSSGNLIGIGTTSPAAKLHVNTTDNSTTPLQIQGLNATGQQVTLLSTQNVTGNTTSLTDFCISGGKCLSGVISSGAETDPMWTANITNYFTKAQWNATNSSYALNQTLTDMWTPFLSTTNSSYLMIDKFNVTNTSYREKYNLTWVGNLNVTQNFSVNNNNLFVDSATGNVGIGTTSPLDILHVKTVSPNLAIERSTTSNEATIKFKTLTTENWEVGTGLSAVGSNLDFYDSVSGQTRMIIMNGTGNVGIGTTAPSALLDINGSAGSIEFDSSGVRQIFTRATTSYIDANVAGGQLAFIVNGNADESPSLFLKADGNVGIGTTAPSSKLHINTTDNSTTPLQIQGLNATGQQVTLLSTQNVTGNTTSLTDFCISGGKCLSGVISSGAETDPMWTANITNYFTKAQWNVTNASYALNQTLTDMWTPFLSTTNASYLMIDKFNVTNTTYREKYNLTWVGNLNVTQNFSVNNNNLFVDSATGNVGIGTTAPGTKLHILGSSDSVLRIENSGANSNPGIEIKNDAETWTLQTVGARADNFEIYDVGSGATRLAIDQSGNVGIGTTVTGEN